MSIAETPKPPYYAVIFTSERSGQDALAYAETAARMIELAAAQPGFLGIESAGESRGITVSYWTDLAAINRWKADLDHKEAQRQGRERWYSRYRVRIARVEADYGV